jgi:hypothetical protein
MMQKCKDATREENLLESYLKGATCEENFVLSKAKMQGSFEVVEEEPPRTP